MGYLLENDDVTSLHLSVKMIYVAETEPIKGNS